MAAGPTFLIWQVREEWAWTDKLARCSESDWRVLSQLRDGFGSVVDAHAKFEQAIVHVDPNNNNNNNDDDNMKKQKEEV